MARRVTTADECTAPSALGPPVSTRCSGHEVGSAGRKAVGDVECEVSIVAFSNRAARLWRYVVRRVDAVDRGFGSAIALECEEELEFEAFLISDANVSISSRIIECTRRCILLCLSSSNRYSGNVRSVSSKDVHDCGRKICTCSIHRATRLFISAFKRASIVFPAARIRELRRWSITSARRGTLIWLRESKMMTMASWPPSAMEEEENTEGKIAWEMMM